MEIFRKHFQDVSNSDIFNQSSKSPIKIPDLEGLLVEGSQVVTYSDVIL